MLYSFAQNYVCLIADLCVSKCYSSSPFLCSFGLLFCVVTFHKNIKRSSEHWSITIYIKTFCLSAATLLLEKTALVHRAPILTSIVIQRLSFLSAASNVTRRFRSNRPHRFRYWFDFFSLIQKVKNSQLSEFIEITGRRHVLVFLLPCFRQTCLIGYSSFFICEMSSWPSIGFLPNNQIIAVHVYTISSCFFNNKLHVLCKTWYKMLSSLYYWSELDGGAVRRRFPAVFASLWSYRSP